MAHIDAMLRLKRIRASLELSLNRFFGFQIQPLRLGKSHCVSQETNGVRLALELPLVKGQNLNFLWMTLCTRNTCNIQQENVILFNFFQFVVPWECFGNVKYCGCVRYTDFSTRMFLCARFIYEYLESNPVRLFTK